LQGQPVVLNLSASNDIVGKSEYRRSLVSQQSSKCMAGYVYASSGVDDINHRCSIRRSFNHCRKRDGYRLKQKDFPERQQLIFADIDTQRLVNDS
jgi:NAD+ synthase (glutamine-hydrolysing)